MNETGETVDGETWAGSLGFSVGRSFELICNDGSSLGVAADS